jgi:hypothetical protein
MLGNQTRRERSDAEILLASHRELRGCANDSADALKSKRERRTLERLWRGSVFTTLAATHKTSGTKTAKRLKTTEG